MRKSELRTKAKDTLDNIALFEREYIENGHEETLSNETATAVKIELEKIKNYIEKYSALIRKLPDEDPPLLPEQLNDTLDAEEVEKKEKRTQRILNSQQQYKLLELGLNEFSRDFDTLKNQVVAVPLPEQTQLESELSLLQQAYLELYESLQQDVEQPPISVSSMIVTDPELQTNLNLLKDHCKNYKTLVKQTKKIISEVGTVEEQLVFYKYGVEQLKEYRDQYELYRQNVNSRVQELQLIENDYYKAIVDKNTSIASAKEILNSPGLQHSLESMSDSNHSLLELIDEVDKSVKEMDEQKDVNAQEQVVDMYGLSKVIQQSQHDKEALDYSVGTLHEHITKIQQQQQDLGSEQLTALQNEFNDLYDDIKIKLDRALLHSDEIALIKSQFDTTLQESYSTRYNQPMFITEKITHLKEIISQLHHELPQQEQRIRNKLIFDIKFVQKGITSQQNQIFDQIRTSHFKLSSLEQEISNAVLGYQAEMVDEQGLSLGELTKQLIRIKEEYQQFTKEFDALQGIVAIHSAVKNLFRADKTLTIDTFIEATNSTIYGGQMLVILAQYIKKEQLIKVIEKSSVRFNDTGLSAVNEFYNLCNVDDLT